MLGPDDPAFHAQRREDDRWVEKNGEDVDVLGLELKIGCRVQFMLQRKPATGKLLRYHPRFMTAIIEIDFGHDRGKRVRVKVDRQSTFGEAR